MLQRSSSRLGIYQHCLGSGVCRSSHHRDSVSISIVSVPVSVVALMIIANRSQSALSRFRCRPVACEATSAGLGCEQLVIPSGRGRIDFDELFIFTCPLPAPPRRARSRPAARRPPLLPPSWPPHALSSHVASPGCRFSSAPPPVYGASPLSSHICASAPPTGRLSWGSGCFTHIKHRNVNIVHTSGATPAMHQSAFLRRAGFASSLLGCRAAPLVVRRVGVSGHR